MRASGTSAAEARANIRCACAATDAGTTSPGNHQRRPDITAQPAASAARKNIAPNHGFQYGLTASPGPHAIMTRMALPAATPPVLPKTDQAASIASDAQAIHHTAAPHNTPRTGSTCTGTASSQY